MAINHKKLTSATRDPRSRLGLQGSVRYQRTGPHGYRTHRHDTQPHGYRRVWSPPSGPVPTRAYRLSLGSTALDPQTRLGRQGAVRYQRTGRTYRPARIPMFTHFTHVHTGTDVHTFHTCSHIQTGSWFSQLNPVFPNYLLYFLPLANVVTTIFYFISVFFKKKQHVKRWREQVSWFFALFALLSERGLGGGRNEVTRAWGRGEE